MNQLDEKQIQIKVLRGKIEVLDSLFELGLKNVHQMVTTPVKIYNDVINPLKQELENQLKELIGE